MSWRERWSWWRERRRHHPPDDIHRAGELAEQRLSKLCRAAGKTNGWHVFESVRIPDAEQGGKREIDLVILGGHTLLVIEQKHWSGSFTINTDEEFIQERNNGTSHNHSKVAKRIERKARMLAAMIDVADLEVEVLLAFTHPKLEWPSNVDALDSEVLNERGMIDRLEQVKPGAICEEALTFMNRTATWDEVVFHGGLMSKGDALDIGLGQDINTWVATSEEAVEVEVEHRRSFFSLWSPQPSIAVVKQGSRGLRITLPRTAKLKMHVVGQSSPESMPWSTVGRVRLSANRLE